jgi:hypothetical protein
MLRDIEVEYASLSKVSPIKRAVLLAAIVKTIGAKFTDTTD